MKLNMKDKLVVKLVNLPNNSEVFTSLRWRNTKKRKILYLLKKLGYYRQIGRFSYIRTIET